jgi:hypothetical protein
MTSVKKFYNIPARNSFRQKHQITSNSGKMRFSNYNNNNDVKARAVVTSPEAPPCPNARKSPQVSI